MLTSDIVKALTQLIGDLPEEDKERAYQISMFLLISHLDDEYREKFLEHITYAIKIYHSDFSPECSESVINRNIKWPL